MIQDYLHLITTSILHRKLRSWLTIIAIVIGIASVVSLIEVSHGLQATITAQFEVFGADKLIIAPASKNGPPNFYTGLTTKDLEAVERVPGLEEVIPYLAKSATATFRNEEKRISFLYGIPAEKTEALFRDFGITASEGRLFTTNSFHAVLGPQAAKELFTDEVRIKNRIAIAGKNFEVVGILQPVGNPQDDSVVYIPLAVMRDVFDDRTTVSSIQAKVKPGRSVPDVASEVTRELKKVRNEEEFDVLTAEQLLEQLGTILAIVQAVLVSIAAISLLVGAVGIANVMYTAILERTRQIGVMKAVGAANNTILLMFVAESGLMGAIGGVLGTVLGIVIAKGVGIAASAAGWDILTIRIEPLIIAGSIAFSIVVGAASGALPARQASQLKVVDALRYGK